MTMSIQDKASKALLAELSLEQPQLSKVEHYINEGANVNYQSEKDGYTPLMLAVDRDDESLVALLLDKGANPGLKNHHQEIASDLALTHSPIYLLLKNNELLVAIMENDMEGVKAALAAGADVNYQGREGYFALLIAVEDNNLEIIELLLASGADKNLETPDGYGVFDPRPMDSLVIQTLDYGKPFTEEEKHFLMNKGKMEDEDEARREQGRLKTLAARKTQPFTLGDLKIIPKSFQFKLAPSGEELNELEKHYGHTLPPILVELFTKYNGGIPMLRYYGDDEHSSIRGFYTVDDLRDSPGNIWWAIKNYSDYLGLHTLPFAQDSYGGVIYLKWIDDRAQVWLFQYGDQPFAEEDDQSSEEDEIGFTCNCIFNSIEEFLEDLYEVQE